MCAGCEQFINIQFDVGMMVGTGEYHQKIPNTTTDPLWHSSDHEYVIGINGLQSIDELPAVLFAGIKNATDRPQSNQDTDTDIFVDGWHNLRIKMGENGALTPLLAAWISHILYAGLASVMLYRSFRL